MRICVFTPLFVWLVVGVSLAQQTATTTLRDERVVVLKKERTLQLLRDGKVIKTYRVALGGDPIGPKTRLGDHKTPEGVYVLDSRNIHSQFHKSIHISYPTLAIVPPRRKWARLRAETYSFTDCPTATDG